MNSNEVPYFVLPLPRSWAEQFGIQLGDYAAVIHRHKLAVAVFADQGPKNKLGEGSVELLRRLGNERVRPDGSVINAGMGPWVFTVVFPGSGAQIHRANQSALLQAIDGHGLRMFTALQNNIEVAA